MAKKKHFNWLSGCLKTKPQTKASESPKIWWGKAGDKESWQKAEEHIIQKSNWIVISQSLYKEQ